MAQSNGARKVPAASGQSSAKSSIVDPSLIDKAMKDSDRRPVKIKIKRTAPKQTIPGNWMENKFEGSADKKELDAVSTAESPLVNSVDPDIKAAFPTGKPFEDAVDLVQCKHCKKPVSRQQAAKHIKDCLRKKQEKLQKKKEAKEAKDAALRKERNGGVSPDPSVDEAADGKRGSVSARKSSQALDADSSVAKKTGKKRKADDDGKGPSAKKKKKDDPKAKPNKTKGPVDVEKQCGVPLPNGQQCARSLTCKSHSMGAKRAVAGRSAPYDVLLAQYQKRNQAKQQRALLDANAPLADDFEPPGTVDSDEEREAVMSSVSRYFRPNPFTGARIGGVSLVAQPLISTRSKYYRVRIKETLSHALSGVNGKSIFATPATTAMNAGPGGGGMLISGGLVSAGGPDGGGIPMSATSMQGEGFDSRRPSIVARSGAMPGSRKASLSGIQV